MESGEILIGIFEVYGWKVDGLPRRRSPVEEIRLRSQR
jgi:hypothetical protein